MVCKKCLPYVCVFLTQILGIVVKLQKTFAYVGCNDHVYCLVDCYQIYNVFSVCVRHDRLALLCAHIQGS